MHWILEGQVHVKMSHERWSYNEEADGSQPCGGRREVEGKEDYQQHQRTSSNIKRGNTPNRFDSIGKHRFSSIWSTSRHHRHEANSSKSSTSTPSTIGESCQSRATWNSRTIQQDVERRKLLALRQRSRSTPFSNLLDDSKSSTTRRITTLVCWQDFQVDSSFVSTDLHDTRTTVQHRNSSCLRFDERQKHKDVC